MTDQEFDQRLHTISELARKQRDGSYSTQSDAWMALNIIETLALLLIENHEAKYGKLTKADDRLVCEKCGVPVSRDEALRNSRVGLICPHCGGEVIRARGVGT